MKWKPALGGPRPTKAAAASALRSTHRVLVPNQDQALRAGYYRMRRSGTALNDADVQATGRRHPSASMAMLRNEGRPQSATPATPAAGEASERERRLRVLQETFGMWKGRDDIPKDGLQYQLEVRAEWD